MRGSGLAAVFRQSVPVRTHYLASKIQPTTFELQLLRVSATSSTVTVVHVYWPQWMSSVPNFVDEFADIIAVITTECTDNIIVCGDMNCPGTDDSSVDDDLSDCLESLGLVQLVKEPTWCVPGAANLLDVLATSVTTIVAIVKVDHCLISADIEVRVPKTSHHLLIT